jgi:hypothetical protein
VVLAKGLLQLEVRFVTPDIDTDCATANTLPLFWRLLPSTASFSWVSRWGRRFGNFSRQLQKIFFFRLLGSAWPLSFFLFNVFFLSGDKFSVFVEHSEHIFGSISRVLRWHLPRVQSNPYNWLELFSVRFYFSLL